MSYSSKDVMHNANLKQVINDVITQMNNHGGIAIVGSPALAIGSSSKAKILNGAFTVVRDGVVSTIDSAETAFTATTHDIADGKEAIFLVYLNGSNAITLLKGDDASADEAVCPDTPSGGLKIGEVKISVTGAIFNATTDDLDAAHVTDTYTNKTDVPIALTDYSDKNWLYHDNLQGVITDMIEIVANKDVPRLVSNPNLAIGTSSKAKIKHDAFTYVLNGAYTTITGGEVAFTATTHDITDGEGAVFLVYLDGSTVKLSKGTATTGGTGAVCPATPAGKLKLGEVKIVTSGALFDASTTLLDAGTVTDTYTNKTDLVATADFSLSSFGQEDYMYSANFKALLDDIEEDLNVVNNDKILGNPTLVIGSSSKKKVKNSAFSVMRDGVISLIASTETDFTATTDDLAISTGAIYNVYLDATNTIKILKGTATAGGTGAVCPATPSGGMKIGEVKIVVNADAIFNATTDDLDSAHITDTYTNKLDVFEAIA
ncbi:MAG: hypothetical protein PHE21_00070 [Candidatus Dojkabacteria bacterium]|nr:hypothetical protein [Candidatus Dojkabacteria bacterium]